MKKIFRLKSWDKVSNHHFISKETWDALTESDLEVDFLTGFFETTALIHKKDTTPTLGNFWVVDKADLYVPEKPKKAENKKSEAKVTTEKTYTKDDVRRAGVRAMEKIEDTDTAIASALAIASLINELN